MAVVEIDLVQCINCGWCRRVCPTETIKYFATGHRTHIVEADGCIDCGICMPICPVQCIHPVEDYTVSPEHLAAAREKAKSFAANQRRIKQQRDVVVGQALERLAAGSAAHA